MRQTHATGLPSFLIEMFLNRRDKKRANESLYNMYQGLEQTGPTPSGAPNYGGHTETVEKARAIQSYDPRKALSYLVDNTTPEALIDRQKAEQELSKSTLQNNMLQNLVSNPGTTDRGRAAAIFGASEASMMYPNTTDVTGKINPGLYTPESVQQWQRSVSATNPNGDMSLLKPRDEVVDLNGIKHRVTYGEFGQPQLVPIDSVKNQADVLTSGAQATTLGQQAGQRRGELTQDISSIDEEVRRAEEMLAKFESGEVGSGLIEGNVDRLFNTASAAEIGRYQGQETIDKISEATFGALSEGEREFLSELGVRYNVDEEVNKSYLKRKIASLNRTKGRLRDEIGALDSGQRYTPKEGNLQESRDAVLKLLSKDKLNAGDRRMLMHHRGIIERGR